MTVVADRGPHRPGSVVTAEQFKAAFRTHAGGVALITADAGEGPAALTATSVFSVSVDPHLFVFSVSDASSSAPVLSRAGSVVAHLLDADDLALAQLGATSGVDRFAETSLWTRLTTGEPLFRGVRTWIRGRVIDRLPTGSATLLVVEAEEVRLGSDGDKPAAPLVHHDRTWHRLDEGSRIPPRAPRRRFEQLGYVTCDLDALMRVHRDHHGVADFLVLEPAAPDAGPRVGLAYKDGVMIEIIQPVPGAEGVYGKADPGAAGTLHHIAYVLDDLEALHAIVDDYRRRGYDVPVSRDTGQGVWLAYVDTRGDIGLFTELLFLFEGGHELFARVPVN